MMAIDEGVKQGDLVGKLVAQRLSTKQNNTALAAKE